MITLRKLVFRRGRVYGLQGYLPDRHAIAFFAQPDIPAVPPQLEPRTTRHATNTFVPN